jgi:hypothetical protein
MESVLRPIDEGGIVNPGDIYILHDREEKWDPGPIEYMYFIRGEEELMPALKREIEYIMEYTIFSFLGWTKISENCIEFLVSCYNPEEGCIEYSIYLHRIRSLEETLRDDDL